MVKIRLSLDTLRRTHWDTLISALCAAARHFSMVSRSRRIIKMRSFFGLFILSEFYHNSVLRVYSVSFFLRYSVSPG